MGMYTRERHERDRRHERTLEDMTGHRGHTSDTKYTRYIRDQVYTRVQGTQGIQRVQGTQGTRNTHILSHDILDKRVIVYYNNNIRILFLVVLSRPLTLGRTTRARIIVRGDA